MKCKGKQAQRNARNLFMLSINPRQRKVGTYDAVKLILSAVRRNGRDYVIVIFCEAIFLK
jgi:hypothetical protein